MQHRMSVKKTTGWPSPSITVHNFGWPPKPKHGSEKSNERTNISPYMCILRRTLCTFTSITNLVQVRELRVLGENLTRLELPLAQKTGQLAPVHQLALINRSTIIFITRIITVTTVGCHQPRLRAPCSWCRWHRHLWGRVDCQLWKFTMHLVTPHAHEALSL